MKKTCSKCKLDKDISEFHISTKKPDGRHAYCKLCVKARNRERFLSKRGEYSAYVKQRRKETHHWLNEFKSTLKCEKCGESHPACLDFHHKDAEQKEFAISAMWTSYSKSRILKEMEKCVVWCCKCHRIFHWEERNKAQLLHGDS